MKLQEPSAEFSGACRNLVWAIMFIAGTLGLEQSAAQGANTSPVGGQKAKAASKSSSSPPRLSIKNRAFFIKGGQFFKYSTKSDKLITGYPKSAKSILRGWDRADAAVAWSKSRAYLFKGGEYLQLRLRTETVADRYPEKIKGNWKGVWDDGVDAAVNAGNGRVYFFKGDEYVHYSMKASKALSKPKKIKGNWPGLWESGIDAALSWGDGTIYFFKGDEYMGFNLKKNKVGKGYPKKIKDGWKGVPRSSIGAALKLN